MQAHHRRVAFTLAVSTLVCGLILVLDWEFGRPSNEDSISELLIHSEKEVPKLLAARASRDQSLADAEAAKVKELEAKLKALQKPSKAKKTPPAKTATKKKAQSLASADRASEDDDDVLAGNTGEGYWDKNHKDDVWMPVGEISAGVDERHAENEAEVETRKAGAYQWNVVGDKFENHLADKDAESKVENEVVSMNSEESEFNKDDDFVTPPAEISPTHRLPLQSYEDWQLDLSKWLNSWTKSSPSAPATSAAPAAAAAPAATGNSTSAS